MADGKFATPAQVSCHLFRTPLLASQRFHAAPLGLAELLVAPGAFAPGHRSLLRPAAAVAPIVGRTVAKENVSKEVTDIWTNFRLEVEKGKYPSAIIMVNGPADSPSLFVKHRQQRNFVFTQKDGKWQRLLPSIWQERKE